MSTQTTQDRSVKISEIDLSSFFPIISPQNNPLISLLSSKKEPKKLKSLYMYKMVDKQEDSIFTGGRTEGMDYTGSSAPKYEGVKNICEIFADTISISGTLVDGFDESGQSLLYAESMKKMAKLKKDFEKNILSIREMTEEGRRNLAGLGSFVKEPIDLKGGPLSPEIIEKAAKTLFDKGFMSDEVYLVVNSADAINLKDSYIKAKNGENTKVNINTGDKTIGIQITKVLTMFGEINILYTPNINAGRAYLLNLDCLELGFLRKPQIKKLGKTGDNTTFLVIMEGTFIANPSGVVRFTNIGDKLPANLGQ